MDLELPPFHLPKPKPKLILSSLDTEKMKMGTRRKKREEAPLSLSEDDDGDENENSQNEGSKRVKNEGYEQAREQRIKENMERMQKLGLFDLSHKLKPLKKQKKRTHQPNHSPQRRSFRFFLNFYVYMCFDCSGT